MLFNSLWSTTTVFAATPDVNATRPHSRGQNVAVVWPHIASPVGVPPPAAQILRSPLNAGSPEWFWIWKLCLAPKQQVAVAEAGCGALAGARGAARDVAGGCAPSSATAVTQPKQDKSRLPGSRHLAGRAQKVLVGKGTLEGPRLGGGQREGA